MVQQMSNYDFKAVEESVLLFWKTNNTYAKAKAKNKGKKPFYFLDGPPYTSGKVHIGTAWNKSLKDTVLRYKRMQGFDVWDRAGYDMHGLPVEHATEKKLNIHGKEAIRAFGVTKFIGECKKLCIENMEAMNQDFERLGVWMDFTNAYQSITPSFIDGEWWLIKRAHETGRLYEGERAMTWCASCATALAKHELEYKDITDDSIYLKFKIAGTENEYLLIWTTTPWTIPLNLAVVVHPQFDYVKCKVGNEIWIVAKELAERVIKTTIGKDYAVVEELKGKDLEGIAYLPPFADQFPEINEARKEQHKIFTVLLSDEYVNLDDGTGLVHFAPGCGDADYELCVRQGIQPFNVIDEHGVYPKDHPLFGGLVAKKDDKNFIALLEENGALLACTKCNHSYAHCWRCKKPIVYKTTRQWFFKVEDLKKQMILENKTIRWVPEAAFNAFESWLQNLRDNSISKQRFWGTPLPIWRNENDPNDYLVVGSKAELESLAGVTIDDLHISTVDQITIQKNGKTYRRIPDILDVWVDAGTVSWNCLDYPHQAENLENLFPADFILEGKDQIRGWFNLLMVASMIAFGKPSFTHVYMHGFVQDAQGRKMSKSLGNYILPQEVIDKYGADTFRYYTMGGANPGIDLNYNFEDMQFKHRNLLVLWNLQRFIIDLSMQTGTNPAPLVIAEENLSFAEQYILSRMNSAIKNTTEKYDNYFLNEVPGEVENLYLDLSRIYIQLIREKSATGSPEEKKAVLWTCYTVFLTVLKLMAAVTPFITEQIYQQLRERYHLNEESIHLLEWPVVMKEQHQPELEEHMNVVQGIVTTGLHMREKMGMNVRWPLKEVIIETRETKASTAIEALREIIMTQLNVKAITVEELPPFVTLKVRVNYKAIASGFGDKTPMILAKLVGESEKALRDTVLTKGQYAVRLDNERITLMQEHFIVERTYPDTHDGQEWTHGFIYLNKERTQELDAEGYAREVMRRVQNLRKTAGLEKKDRIQLVIVLPQELQSLLKSWEDPIAEKVGASSLKLVESIEGTESSFSKTENMTIKGKAITIAFSQEQV
ncbi:isoleucine--tRNA ligase [Candidatus Woesearchaeota archaeon]|nr:isoleucine--tRNA ligase [Candidatus Woesearchaeota archaeon]